MAAGDPLLANDVNGVIGYSAVTGNPVVAVTTTELTVATVNAALQPNFAYNVTFRCQITGSATLDMALRLKRPANTTICDGGLMQVVGATGDRYLQWSCSFRTQSTFVAATTALTVRAQTASGTANFKGFTSLPCEILVERIGKYADCPGMTTY